MSGTSGGTVRTHETGMENAQRGIKSYILSGYAERQFRHMLN